MLTELNDLYHRYFNLIPSGSPFLQDQLRRQIFELERRLADVSTV